MKNIMIILIPLLISNSLVQAQVFNKNLAESEEITLLSAKKAEEAYDFNTRNLYQRVKSGIGITDLVGSELHITISPRSALVNGHNISKLEEIQSHIDYSADAIVGIEKSNEIDLFVDLLNILEGNNKIKSLSIYFYSEKSE